MVEIIGKPIILIIIVVVVVVVVIVVVVIIVDVCSADKPSSFFKVRMGSKAAFTKGGFNETRITVLQQHRE